MSDIHANFPALVAALEEAERANAAQVVFAGDLVGRGPNPVEVLRLIRGRGYPVIRGNVERKLVARVDSADGKDAVASRKKNLGWTAACLGPAEWEFLRSLPEELSLEIAGRRVRVVHGSPCSDEDYIFPSITARALADKLKGDRPDVLVCGHSHLPFTRTIGGVRVINCGSLGSPYDGDARGSFCLAEFGVRHPVKSRIVRFEYPVARVVEDLLERHVPGTDPRTYMLGVRDIRRSMQKEFSE
ncbi:MAG: metallophosphoesterase family protein [Acidobacteria bacterium]|nr:metallophosphoesterase family protein [Acidobacteriota bacterium]